MANKVLIPREAVAFLKEESTRGTLVFPAATDALVLAGQGEVNQAATYTDSEELVGSRSLLDQFRDGLPAGEWSFPTYIRPSGVAGTAPQERALWKGLLGVETDGANDVAYTPSVNLPSFSFWLKLGNVVLFAAGLSINKLELKGSKKGAVTATWSGKFLKLGWCGEDALAEAISATPDTSVLVADASRFTVGARIQVGTDDNSGAGYAVTAVDTGTNTLTVNPGVGTPQLLGAAVVAFLPDPTFGGAPVEGRERTLVVGGVTTKYREFGLTVENGIEYLEDEVTGTTNEYPTDFLEGARKVSGSFSTVFRSDDLARFAAGLAGEEVALSWESYADAVAGAKFKVELGRVKLQTPTIGDAGPARGLESKFAALATSGEDEIAATYE